MKLLPRVRIVYFTCLSSTLLSFANICENVRSSYGYMKYTHCYVLNFQTHKVQKCLQKLLRSLHKDRHHTIAHYRHLLASSIELAEREKSVTLEHLVDIDHMVNQSLQMLYRYERINYANNYLYLLSHRNCFSIKFYVVFSQIPNVVTQDLPTDVWLHPSPPQQRRHSGIVVGHDSGRGSQYSGQIQGGTFDDPRRYNLARTLI